MKARIQQETECRSLLTTPMEQREDTTRTLVNGPLAQGTNLALGGGLLALGVVGFASIGSCASPPCSADERKRSDTRYAAFGGIATGLALIPLGLFVWNIFRARDEARVVGLAPRVEGTPWRACGSLPLSNASLALHAGNVDLAGKTDSNGEVTFPLKGIAASTSDPNEALISADQQNAPPATVTLSATPSYASWSAARHADHDAQLAKLAQAQRERDEATAKRNEQVARLKGECAKNKGESCYQLGDSLSGTEGMQYLQAACELKHKVACTTHDARAREAERAAAIRLREEREAEAAEARRQHARQAILQAGRTVVSARLKAPTQASWGGAIVEERGTCHLVEVVVDAPNSFGVMIRNWWLLTIVDDPAGGLSLLTAGVGPQRFDEAPGPNLVKAYQSVSAWEQCR